MKRFWRVFRWIFLLVLLLAAAGIYYVTKAGLMTFDDRFTEAVELHSKVYNSLEGNVERALPDSLLAPLDQTITYLEDNKEALNEVPSYAVLLSDLFILRGNDLSLRRHFAEAIKNYLKAKSNLYTTSDWYPFKKQSLGNVHNLLHLAYDSNGDLFKAEEEIKESINYFENVGEKRWIGLARMNLARINSLEKNYEMSIENALLSIAAYEEVNKTHNDSIFLVSAYRRLAADYALLSDMAKKRKDTEASKELEEKALNAGRVVLSSKHWFSEEEHTYQWALILQDITMNWLNSPLVKYEEEINMMLNETEQGLSMAKRPGIRPYRSTQKVLKGEWLLRAGERAAAEKSIKEGLELLGHAADSNWELSMPKYLVSQNITSLMIYSRVLPYLLKGKGALRQLKVEQSIIEAIQQTNRQLTGDVIQLALSNQERSIYTRSIRTALKLLVSEEAIAMNHINFVAECQRAQILQKNLQRDEWSGQLNGEGKDWMETDEALKKRLGNLYAQLSRVRKAEEIVSLELEINEATQERANLINTLSESFKDGYFQTFVTPKVPSFQRIKSAMEPNQALVQYIEMEQSMLVVCITKKGIHTYETPAINEWETDLKEFNASFDNDTGKTAFSKSAKGIYDVCIAPIISSLSPEISYLSFITDGPLRAVNLETCLTRLDETKNYQTFDYLMNDYGINYEYLITSYFDHLKETPTGENQELVVCAPPYTTTSTTQCESHNSIDSLYQFAIKMADGLSVVTTTKEELREASIGKKNIFFAAHGIVNTDKPMRSYILLSPDEFGDCHLYLGELMNWDLQGANIILGSCTTEAGKNVSGSGILSIAQAITIAGAQSLVANTGLVKDEQTAKLLRFYFQYLEMGYKRVDALRAAKLQYLKTVDDDITPPMNWAKTVLIGQAY